MTGSITKVCLLRSPSPDPSSPSVSPLPAQLSPSTLLKTKTFKEEIAHEVFSRKSKEKKRDDVVMGSLKRPKSLPGLLPRSTLTASPSPDRTLEDISFLHKFKQKMVSGQSEGGGRYSLIDRSTCVFAC